jgi:CubicO group peptidase (beta-lactamase class C family)
VPDTATPPALEPSAVRSAVRYLDSWLAFRRDYLRVPGVQAALWHDDALALSTAHGVADEPSGAPLTTSHLFRVASHSKTFTATAVLQLHEQGRLRLDDSLATWLPWLQGAPLGCRTVRELLAHGGGVTRDGRDGDHWQLFREFPDEAALRSIATDDADVLPANDRFKYSNIGYGLLGLVVAAAAGRPYADQVRTEIVEALGLRDTGPELDADREADVATGHSALAYADHRVPVDQVGTGALASATGFYSTAEDLCRYASAHFLGDPRLLSDEAKRLAQHAEWKVEGSPTSYGLGFAIHDIGGRRMLGHGGGWPGHITRTLFDPAARLAVSVLTNAVDGPALELTTGAVRLVDLACAHPVADEAATAVQDTFCGRYASLWGVLDVARLGGRLYGIDPTVADPADEPVELEVTGPDTLRFARAGGYGSYGEQLHATRGADGTITALRGGSGTTSYPIAAFRAAVDATDRVRLGVPLRPPVT